MLQDDDMLFTNRFTPDLDQSAGYGISGFQHSYDMKRAMEQNVNILDDIEAENQEDLADDDILKTNPVITLDGEAKQLDKHRVHKEVRHFINIQSNQRERYKDVVVARNPDTGLYTREVEEDGQISVQVYNASILNHEFEPTADDVPLPYYTNSDGTIMKRNFLWQHPNQYEIRLPHIYSNIKSARLLSVEVPNTLMTINEYNNVIILDIFDEDTDDSVPLIYSSPFSFLIIQFDVGNYTLSELISHMQTRINSQVQDNTEDGFTNLFTVSVNTNTGKVSITLNDPTGRDLSFHLKFFSTDIDGTPSVPEYNNLWYILGFITPFQTNTDGSPKYVKEWTNLFDFGQNKLLDDHQTSEGVVPDSTSYHLVRPYRFPDVTPAQYIYLIVEEFGQTITDVPNQDNSKISRANIFAKILLNVPVGNTTYTFVPTVRLFTDAPLHKLERLRIKWVDYAGNPVNFNGREHSFTLEIVEYQDMLETNHYDSQRGTIDKTSAPEVVRYTTTV